MHAVGRLANIRRRIPSGLIGSMLLVVAVERSFGPTIADLMSETVDCWRYSATSARTIATRCEILGFGDSLMKFGFQPRVIEARTGRSAFNLAVYGGPPSQDFLSLQRVIMAGGKPTALVVGFQAIHFGKEPRFHAREFAEAISASEAFQLAWTSSDPGLFGWLTVDRLLSSARARYEIRSRIVASLAGENRSDPGLVRAIFRRNWMMSRGAHVQSEDPRAPTGMAAVARALELYPWTMNPPSPDAVELQYIRKFLDLALERRIPVFWVIPPMLPEIRDRMEEIGLATITTNLAAQMRAEYSNVVVIDGRASKYDASAFCADAVHLNSKGANAMSRDLAIVIRRHFAEPKNQPAVVALPEYHAGDPEVGLEDFAHSSKVVTEGRQVRR